MPQRADWNHHGGRRPWLWLSVVGCVWLFAACRPFENSEGQSNLSNNHLPPDPDPGTGPYPHDMASWDEAEKARQREAGRELLATISAAVERGEKTFTAPVSAGHYRFNELHARAAFPERRAYVNLNGIRDLAIDLRGATFWFEDHECGIAIHDCHNLTIRNLFLDWDPLPYTQGTIRDFDPAERTLVVELDEGYERVTPRFQAHADPTRNEPHIQSSVYAAADLSRLKSGHGDFRPMPFWGNQVGPRTYRTKIAHPVDFALFGLERGDKITMSMRTGVGIHQTATGNVVLEDVTLYASPCFAFFEVRGPGGNTYRRCRIIRRPGTNRLLGTNADGFHSAGMERGPLIEECQIDSINDDCVNIHGTFAAVLWQEDPRTLIVSRNVFPFALNRQDLTVRLFREQDLAQIGTVTTTRVEEIPWRYEEGRVFVFPQRRPDSRPPAYGTEMTVVRLSLRDPVTITDPTLAVIEDYVGRGTVIRNCAFRNTTVRGMLLHTIDALVEGNTISHTGREAVKMGPGTYWRECTFPREIRIRNNVFVNNGMRVWHYNVTRAAIWLDTPDGVTDGGPDNIAITNNVFRDQAGAVAVIHGARNVRIAGNTITGTHRLPSASQTTTPEKVFVLERVENATITDNVITGLGPYGKDDGSPE